MNLQWEDSRTRPNKEWELIQLSAPGLNLRINMPVARVGAKRPRRRRQPRYFIARIFERGCCHATSKVFHDLEEAKAWCVAVVRMQEAV